MSKRTMDRIRSLIAEMNQALDELERAELVKPRKPPSVPVAEQPSQGAIDAVRRKLRRGGFAA